MWVLCCHFKLIPSRYSAVPNDDTEIDLLGDEDDNEDLDDLECPAELLEGSKQPLWVLPLYSLLPSHKQAQVSGRLTFIYARSLPII